MQSSPKKMTLFMLTASIAGNMMGSGIFLLPTSLAKIGGLSIFGWIFTSIGAAALALVFAKLSLLQPQAGGPYVFAKNTFGTYMGFQTAFLYWMGAWIGNIALALAVTGYMSYFFPTLSEPVNSILFGITIVWILTILNLFGPRTLGRFQSWTTGIMLLPILGTAIFGWFWFNPQIFSDSFNVSADKNTFVSISQAASMTLWAFVGVETASVNAGVVENPSRNIPIATVVGVLLAAIGYILSTTAILGIVPADKLSASSSPFSLAATYCLGSTAGTIVSACAVISCMGTLAGWTLVTSQISKAAADDGLFPKFFSLVNKKNTPYLGLIFSAILVTILFALTISPSLSKHFETITGAAVFTIVLPYLTSSCALLALGLENKLPKKEKKILGFVSIVAILFSIWSIWGLGQTLVYYGTLLLMTSTIFYLYPLTKYKKTL